MTGLCHFPVSWIPRHGEEMKKQEYADNARKLVEQLVEGGNRQIDWIPGLAQSRDFLLVVAEYLKQFPDDAENKTLTLVYWLSYLMYRFGDKYKLKGYTDVAFDKKWFDIKKYWEEQKEELIRHLTDAARIFESGQVSGDHIYDSLQEFANRGGEDIINCDQVRRWIEVIRMSPVEYLFPAAKPDRYGGTILQEHVVGTSGKASDSESAARGAVVRQIAHYIPQTLKNKAAITASLLELIGVPLGENGRQYVTSLADKKRKTPLVFMPTPSSDEFRDVDVTEVLDRPWTKK